MSNPKSKRTTAPPPPDSDEPDLTSKQLEERERAAVKEKSNEALLTTAELSTQLRALQAQVGGNALMRKECTDMRVELRRLISRLHLVQCKQFFDAWTKEEFEGTPLEELGKRLFDLDGGSTVGKRGKAHRALSLVQQISNIPAIQKELDRRMKEFLKKIEKEKQLKEKEQRDRKRRDDSDESDHERKKSRQDKPASSSASRTPQTTTTATANSELNLDDLG